MRAGGVRSLPTCRADRSRMSGRTRGNRRTGRRHFPRRSSVARRGRRVPHGRDNRPSRRPARWRAPGWKGAGRRWGKWGLRKPPPGRSRRARGPATGCLRRRARHRRRHRAPRCRLWSPAFPAARRRRPGIPGHLPGRAETWAALWARLEAAERLPGQGDLHQQRDLRAGRGSRWVTERGQRPARRRREPGGDPAG